MNIFQMSISASAMIAAVVMIRALALHKLPKKTFLVLWGAVIFRLLIPFSIPSRFSFYTGINMVKGMFAERASVSSSARTLGVSAMSGVPGTGISAETGMPAISIPAVEFVWLAVACTCALFFILAYIKCRKEFKTSLPVENGFVSLWLLEHSLRRPVQIRQSDRIKAPLTYGIFRPVILFPRKTDWTDETRLKVILAHEFVHIRRFDTLTKLVLTAAVCVHWFNPFVWIMYVLANRDIELSCDETVVRTFGEIIKSAYAMTLIELEEKKSHSSPLVNNFSKNAIEERIVSIMKMKKTSLVGTLLALTLILGTTTVFATNALTVNKPRTDNVHTTSGTASASVTSYTDESGKTRISEDNGKTWISEEDFRKAHPTPNVVWWTYDEYKAWLEQEKINLQTMIGERSWNQTDGWYVWTQETVDETIKMYEGLLEDIKNGMKLSRTIDGSEGTIMMGGSYYPGEIAAASRFETFIINDKGEEIHFGPYDTREKLLAEVQPYCEAQVKSGNMSQQEADDILNKYRN